MRPAGNLAGVSFIDAPLYNANRDTWREIISNSGYFFTRDSMRFFDSRVLWEQLWPLGDGWLFITSERRDGESRRYTVRTWTKESGTDTVGEFQAHDTLKAAHRAVLGHLALSRVNAAFATNRTDN